MAKTYEELLAAATQIKNNELPESNTHTLVGGHLVDMVERQKEDVEEQEKKVGELGNDFMTIASKFLPTGVSVQILDETNLLTKTTYTEKKYLNKNNGEEIPFDIFNFTDYIDVTNIDSLQICSVPNHGGCFYDEDKSYIEGFGYSETSGRELNKIIKVPSIAKYVRINISRTMISEGTAYVIDYSQFPSRLNYPWLETKHALTLVGKRSGYMADNGTINTSIPSGGNINKFGIEEGISKVLVSITGQNLSLNADPKWCTIWVVDSDDLPIQMYPVDTTGNELQNYIVSIPEGGKQIWTQGINSMAYAFDSIDKVINDIYNRINGLPNSGQESGWTGKKIVWLGTSIPYGQGTDGVASAPTTYPMQIGDNLGATVINVARPGMAIETTADFKRKTYGSLSLTIAELQSEGAATTPYQSYENAMLGQNADLYVFDCEPNNSNWDLTDLENFSVQNWKYNDSSSFESHRNSYVGALLFLLDKLWTEKPSAKVVFISEFIKGANLDEQYQGAIASQAVAKKLRIPFINVAEKLYYTALNKSLYLNTDNVHPKQAAHDRIAEILTHELLLIY